jgi:hypothetical protein
MRSSTVPGPERRGCPEQGTEEVILGASGPTGRPDAPTRVRGAVGSGSGAVPGCEVAMTDRTAWGRPRPTRRTAAGPQALPARHTRTRVGVAAPARGPAGHPGGDRSRAGMAGRRPHAAAAVGLRLYAPLGAVIAVHPTVAGAAWRTVLGFGLAVQIAPPIRPGQGPVAVSGSPAVPLALPPRCARSPRGCVSTELDEEQPWRRDCRLRSPSVPVIPPMNHPPVRLQTGPVGRPGPRPR